MTQHRRLFVIDTDTASDDAVALMMALRAPDVEVVAITTVAGNVNVEQATRNALTVVERCGADVPVYRGLSRPLLRPPSEATFFHGQDGMGDLNLPPPRRQPTAEHAVDALIRVIGAHAGAITLVTLGPLSNIAAALIRAPELARQVQQCYVMGGAANTIGNITPAAEYNIWCDPEAAQIVFASGMPILMIGHEHSLGEAVLTPHELDELRRLGPLAQLAVDCNAAALRASTGWLREAGLTQPDPVAMAVALDPTICTQRERCYVAVETHSELTRGMTVVDRWGVLRQPANLEVCYALDAARWKALLRQLLSAPAREAVA
ncbi:nucleoside hydrolase [Kallotenue papyrolyticum]|uniref:nucleoside hydrolase n=1 Tax=Kallotenue papyrolyticum TaxID=1325125 RepID=UPI00047126D9|nr:nucleoside hydrolase [Kallotenue papyrolyticum]